MRTHLLVAAAVALAVTGAAAPAVAAPGTGPRTLAACGFTRTPNVSGWGGTAAISRTKAPRHADVVVSGRAPAGTVPGTVLTLMRYTDVDRRCEAIPRRTGVQTVVAKDGTFLLHMKLGRVGSYGYDLGYVPPGSADAVEIRFQLTTT